jgi:hypothetical protein
MRHNGGEVRSAYSVTSAYGLESEESLQRSFDSTRRKLHRFLSRSPR